MTDTDTNEPKGDEPKGEVEEPSQDEGVDSKAEAAKWKAMSRKHEAAAKSAAKRVQELEDATKSELERAQSASTEATKRAEAAEVKALRYEIAHEKGIKPGLMKFLAGSSREEIEESADELLSAIAPGEASAPPTGTGKPKEKLQSGSSGDDGGGEEKSIADVLAAIPRD